MLNNPIHNNIINSPKLNNNNNFLMNNIEDILSEVPEEYNLSLYPAYEHYL